MTREERTMQLRRQITEQLGGLIGRDYALLGLPYYLNVGDILIWEGERQFLRSLRQRCVNEGWHYKDLRKIGDDTLILLQGGGNFGDLWRFIQDERLSIVQRYMKNTIVIFPVTCWYENAALLQHDARILSKHPDLTICARDARSFDLLKKHFKNRILLVPDLAFCIERASLKRHIHGEGKGTLFLKRTDKELASAVHLLDAPEKADIRDWPSMEKEPPCWIRYRKLCTYGKRIGRCWGLRKLSRLLLKSSDWFYHEHCRKQLILEGVSFIGQYRTIYSTRLHAGILAILLDKEVTIIDNSYGKNSSFYDTWLRDTDGVELRRLQCTN